MGLDTTHGCFNGPYSTFNRFRYSLAAQIGIDLDDYDGYGGNGAKDLASIEHDLMPLFNHSDCDGELSVDESKRLISGFNQVLESFNPDLKHDSSFIDRIKWFRDGCILAVQNNEVIEFH